MISATFLISNYLVVNERIAAMEGKLESLQRGENLNQDVSSDEQTGGKDEHHVRRKSVETKNSSERYRRF